MDYKTILKICLAVFVFVACSDDEKTVEEVERGITRGAVLRTLERTNQALVWDDSESTFSIDVEEQDEADGNLLDFVRLYIRHHDYTGDVSVGNEFVLRDIPASEFENGPNELPVTTVRYTLQEALQATGLTMDQITPGDTFLVRVEIFLKDGRTFTDVNANPAIIADECFFKSPYLYVSPVITPISNVLFTGVYTYQKVNEGQSNFFFEESGITTISFNGKPNGRSSELIDFTVAGENILPDIYQFLTGVCREGESIVFLGPQDDQFGTLNINDDSVFEIDFVIGYDGWVGIGLDREPELVRYRFTKQ